jgi:pyruvate/2-oxoglutarate dehydrogenase complex dihydrolipoamide dehydrogenase (E3) component/rhodanese-related sulfurtransferase
VRAFHSWSDLGPLQEGLSRGEIGRVAVVGAGLVGNELAEAFRSLWGAEVVLLEAAASILPGVLDVEVAECVATHLRSNDVDVRTAWPVEAISAADDGVRVRGGEGASEQVRADVAVVAVGVEPNVELAKQAGAVLGPSGAVAVDQRLATSVAHVWAAGDCVEVRDMASGEPVFRPLGSLANRQGRTLANVLAGRNDAFPSVAGAVAAKVFDFNVAAVGTTEAVARGRGLAPRSTWITTTDRADYWPESEIIHIKLVYEVDTGRVLGVQAVGKGDTVKRVDTATQLISRGVTIHELQHLEHAYAPPYAPAIDPLAAAAFAALNQEDGIEACSPTARLDSVLDVRLPEEREARPAPAHHSEGLSVGALRNGSGVRENAPELVVCERGTRSAEASRLLRVAGHKVRYLGGGLMWRTASGTEKA